MAHEIRITRRLPATPDEVFDAWTDAKSVEQWMFPSEVMKGTKAQIDARVGGKYKIDMVGPDKTFEHVGEYLRLDRPRLLEFTWISEGTGQQRSVVTIELKPAGQETDLTLVHRGLPSRDAADSHTQGWTGILGELAKKFSAVRTR